MKADTATVTANGESQAIQLPCTVADFLGRCGWKGTQVVVEYNGNVLQRDHLASVNLQDGDRLEVIVPVSGG